MPVKYTLTSLEEPTDIQLGVITADALSEVKILHQKAIQRSIELFEREQIRIDNLKLKSSFYINAKK
jgi:hypothetical protein